MYNYLFNDDEIAFNDWDIERLQQIKNIKEIIFATIELISKFEDELRAMWLKPKFVRDLNYIITLDKIDSSLHDEIFQIEKQVNEWRELELMQDEVLLKNEFLPVDTKYLTSELKYKILSSFDNLDEMTDGVLIKSDNFQALNTILPKYREQIDLIYIDPPFNTGSDFAYKDRFQDSTWLTLMENRLFLSEKLLSDKGSFYLHLDYNANYMGRFLLNNEFGKDNFKNEIVWHYEKWTSSSDNFQRNHDLILYYQKSKSIFNELKEITENLKNKYDKGYLIGGGYGSNGLVVYNKSIPKVQELINSGKYQVVYAEANGKPLSDVWKIPFINPVSHERITGALTQKPEILLKKIICASSSFDSIILDFFSGSGTTINTAHKLGRKWIGVEMGSHFESVNIPRIKKTLSGVITGISKELEKENSLTKGGVVKYYSLETYEDVLSCASYSLSEDSLINLYKSEKLATDKVLKIDKEDIKLNIDEVYDDIDIYETISNITGFKIKKLYVDRCLFLDGDKEVEIKKDELLFSEYPFLRKLVWWK